jgi:hypothetical protein
MMRWKNDGRMDGWMDGRIDVGRKGRGELERGR